MENNLERPGYWAILTAEVRYSKEISANAKILFAEITALQNKTGSCWASNKYFADLYGVTVKSVSDWVSQLEAAGFITTKVNKAYGNKRSIRLSHPIEENVNSYRKKGDVNNNKTNTNSIGDLEKSKASDLLLLVNEVTGRQFRTLPERGVKKTLDAFSLAEIRTALTALSQDSWHAPKMKEFKIDYLIRSTTIDKFLDTGTTNSGVTTAGKKFFTEDDDGNQYWGGELITPENQDRVLKERNSQ